MKRHRHATPSVWDWQTIPTISEPLLPVTTWDAAPSTDPRDYDQPSLFHVWQQAAMPLPSSIIGGSNQPNDSAMRLDDFLMDSQADELMGDEE